MSVTENGPLFDGRAEKAIADACEEATKRVAALGARMVRSRLNSVLRVQTPYYRFRVAARQEAPSQWKITDQGVIYGHWLEGDGSRNFPATRFRGYHTFEQITALLNGGRAQQIADATVAEYVRKMN